MASATPVIAPSSSLADKADLPAPWGPGRWLVGALADGKQRRGGQIQVPQNEVHGSGPPGNLC